MLLFLNHLTTRETLEKVDGAVAAARAEDGVDLGVGQRLGEVAVAVVVRAGKRAVAVEGVGRYYRLPAAVAQNRQGVIDVLGLYNARRRNDGDLRPRAK